jgi:hypothetical protein
LPILHESDALLLVLEENLPFTFVEAPRLKSLMHVETDRKRLATLLRKSKGNVANALKAELVSFAHIALVVDEWTDASLRRYIGLKVHCSSEQRYATFCLEHWPLNERGDAKHLAESTLDVLRKYDIDEKVRLVVTDTTRVMPAMVREMGKSWSPCWGHIYNLILSKIVDAVRAECLDELFEFTAAASHSVHWRKLVNSATKYKASALPTYTVTRWYSLWKLLHNAQKMKHEVNQWLTEEKRAPIAEETWVRLAKLLAIVSTFTNATEEIESESFGTLSYIYEGLTLLGLACQKVQWPALATGWQRAYAEYRVRYLGDGTDAVTTTSTHLQFGCGIRDRILLAAVLNPAVNLEKSLTGWEFGKAYDLLQRAWLQASPPSAQDIGVGASPRPARSTSGGLTRRDLLADDEEPIPSEVTRFRAIDRRAMSTQDGFDVFAWWRANEPLFPILCQIAMAHLLVPATSASVERQFSKAKLVNTDRRRSMGEETLSSAIFLSSNMELTERVLKPGPPTGEATHPDE